MTQFSFNWACNPSGGDAGALTSEQLMVLGMMLGNVNPGQAGVVFWTSSMVLPLPNIVNAVDGLLAPSFVSGDTVRIASGVGIVEGRLYVNDENVDFDVSGGNANATDLIVLQRDDPAAAGGQQIRLALVRGPASGTATVTQSSTLWQVPIAEVTLDGSGNYSSFTDVRTFSIAPGAGIILLEEQVKTVSTESSFTFSNIPPAFRHLRLYFSGTGINAGSVAQVHMRLNGDSSNIYHSAGDVASSPNTSAYLFQMNTNVSNRVAAAIEIPNYRETIGRQKAMLSHAAYVPAGGGVTKQVVSAVWDMNATPVTSIELFTPTASIDFQAGSRCSLYGIK
jgi:hypothetical protein